MGGQSRKCSGRGCERGASPAAPTGRSGDGPQQRGLQAGPVASTPPWTRRPAHALALLVPRLWPRQEEWPYLGLRLVWESLPAPLPLGQGVGRPPPSASGAGLPSPASLPSPAALGERQEAHRGPQTLQQRPGTEVRMLCSEPAFRNVRKATSPQGSELSWESCGRVLPAGGRRCTPRVARAQVTTPLKGPPCAPLGHRDSRGAGTV